MRIFLGNVLVLAAVCSACGSSETENTRTVEIALERACNSAASPASRPTFLGAKNPLVEIQACALGAYDTNKPCILQPLVSFPLRIDPAKKPLSATTEVSASAVPHDRYRFDVRICSDLDGDSKCGPDDAVFGSGSVERLYEGVNILPLQATLFVSSTFDPTICDY